MAFNHSHKLCIVYNFAAHYRAGIFRLIDNQYDCDWFFGRKNDDIKKMDYALLKGNIYELRTWEIGPLTWYRGMVGLIREKKYDTFLIFAQTKDLSTWVFCLVARVLYPKKKVYFWSHGWYGKETRKEAWVKKRLFMLPNGGTFLYGNHARELMIKEGLASQNLFVIYNSLNYDEQIKVRNDLVPSSIYKDHFCNAYPNIVFIGRLTKIKRFDLIIEAISLLKDKNEWVNVTFIGDGIERQNTETMAVSKGIQKQVWFYGACYDEKRNAELIYNADLCVSPGNIGLTAMHVMMFGCPAITNDDFAHQMPEFEAIKEGKTGAFFEAGNAAALADRISAWFKNHGSDRDNVRKACYDEIDTIWNPHNQIRIFKNIIKP